MDVEIKMPDLATTTEQVTIIRWLIEVGQPVQLGQPLLEIETDKASMEVESVETGTLKAVHAQAGELVTVGQVVAVIEKAGTIAAVIQPTAAPAVVHVAKPVEAQPTATQPRKTQSLFARNKLAREARPASSGAGNEIVLNPTQRELAQRMLDSKQTIPHYYLNTSANAERLVAARKAAQGQNPAKNLVWDAFFVLAAARAIKAFDRMGYRFDRDRLVRRNTEAIGVAADIDGDLYIIAVDNPLSLTLDQISDHITASVIQLRAGDRAARKLRETCITITNLGAEGIESFMAIINPPESAVLAIGKVAPSVQPDADRVVIQNRVSLSLSVDHRVANGKYAAAFLHQIVENLESF